MPLFYDILILFIAGIYMYIYILAYSIYRLIFLRRNKVSE